jgi:energy-coupling factor transporter transmembrane protein EcfT
MLISYINLFFILLVHSFWMHVGHDDFAHSPHTTVNLNYIWHLNVECRVRDTDLALTGGNSISQRHFDGQAIVYGSITTMKCNGCLAGSTATRDRRNSE